ncbi:hypothetical protein AVEN_166974-1 [Araneus ventricosus]|uniref:Uncharacterized protein n=1 Tax=Araneus ventricosus TaxID=182803 RepID=A0A4Y2GX36_ARAVE|nr:hypothetical protein AVEN_166974-1 [Araneus ventricosus]
MQIGAEEILCASITVHSRPHYLGKLSVNWTRGSLHHPPRQEEVVIYPAINGKWFRTSRHPQDLTFISSPSATNRRSQTARSDLSPGRITWLTDRRERGARLDLKI